MNNPARQKSRYAILASMIACLAACGPITDPQVIVDRAIAAHGGSTLDRAVVEFDYRGKHFKATRNNGLFSYERTFTDSTGDVRQVLNNDEVFQEIDGERTELTDKKRYSIQETLNSVVYFGLTPYFLNDPAVQKKYLGQATIEGEPYHEIEITFLQEDGGPDYEDRFIYWIQADRYTVDYLAYDFHINDGGTRFRKAFNIRTIESVRIADFYNYTADALPQPGTPIETYEELAARDEVNLLSEIVWENVEIRPLE